MRTMSIVNNAVTMVPLLAFDQGGRALPGPAGRAVASSKPDAMTVRPAAA